MPFILGQPSRPVTEVEVITPQDTWDLDLESLHQIVMIYRETEANSSLILPYLTDSSYPYFTSHLTTLRPLTTISLYRQDGSIRGVLLTRRPEHAGGPLSAQAVQYHEQQYHESICDLDEAQDTAEERVLETLTEDMRARYHVADKVCVAAFPKGEQQPDWAIGKALLDSLSANRNYRHIGLKQESSLFASCGFIFLGSEEGYEVDVSNRYGRTEESLVFMMKLSTE